MKLGELCPLCKKSGRAGGASSPMSSIQFIFIMMSWRPLGRCVFVFFLSNFVEPQLAGNFFYYAPSSLSSGRSALFYVSKVSSSSMARTPKLLWWRSRLKPKPSSKAETRLFFLLLLVIFFSWRCFLCAALGSTRTDSIRSYRTLCRAPQPKNSMWGPRPEHQTQTRSDRSGSGQSHSRSQTQSQSQSPQPRVKAGVSEPRHWR